ncbi:hypothetical protein L6164_029635 [Bauhinia variegata]|uniref:Uncharacterized protein n=1 Tax=Bauhinia variegata TaxID=167791 RepID=A0ACB9L9F4_BAUVA|nr:hypothetical protein L6164_029635 [Bauhinia variegata]
MGNKGILFWSPKHSFHRTASAPPPPPPLLRASTTVTRVSSFSQYLIESVLLYFLFDLSPFLFPSIYIFPSLFPSWRHGCFQLTNLRVNIWWILPTLKFVILRKKLKNDMKTGGITSSMG